eukprot:8363669-Pyramimonas_sp.AAC.1
MKFTRKSRSLEVDTVALADASETGGHLLGHVTQNMLFESFKVSLSRWGHERSWKATYPASALVWNIIMSR